MRNDPLLAMAARAASRIVCVAACSSPARLVKVCQRHCCGAGAVAVTIPEFYNRMDLSGHGLDGGESGWDACLIKGDSYAHNNGRAGQNGWQHGAPLAAQRH